MALPPAWYVLLFTVTLLSAPFILRRAVVWERRRFVGRMLGGFLLIEAGLVLLFYAKALCWPLVSAGVVLIASLAGPPGRRLGPVVLVVPALAAGVAFQLLPGVQGFYFYFGFALPLLLLVSIAAAVARFAAGRGLRGVGASVALLAFGAFSPASSFGFTFLEHYEVFQLPVLIAGLVGLFVLARGGPTVVVGADGGRVRTPLAERLDAPWRTRLHPAPFIMLIGLGFGWLALRHAPLPTPFGWIAWGLFGVAGLSSLAMALGLWRRGAVTGVIVAALGGAVGGLIGVRFGAEAFHVFVGGGPAPETLYFYQAGVGLVAFSVAGAMGLARFFEQAGRRRLAAEPSRMVQPGRLDPRSLPSDFLVDRVTALPEVAALERFREQLVAAGRSGGVVEVVEGSLDPMSGLPEPVEAWLDRQEGPTVVHLAVREGTEVFLVPILDEVAQA